MIPAVLLDGIVSIPVMILGFVSDGDGAYAAVFYDSYANSPKYGEIQTKTLWDGSYRKGDIIGRWRFKFANLPSPRK